MTGERNDLRFQDLLILKQDPFTKSGKEVTTMAGTVTYTPYAACKIVNAALAERGIDKILPPQMFYNYTSARVRDGKRPFIDVDSNGRITEAGLIKWMEAYLQKQVVA
jgi:hypothetical protein